jgi:hypothetical protein
MASPKGTAAGGSCAIKCRRWIGCRCVGQVWWWVLRCQGAVSHRPEVAAALGGHGDDAASWRMTGTGITTELELLYGLDPKRNL